MYIKLRVKTKARKEEVIEKGEGVFEISIKEPAEQNRANVRVLELLSDHLKIQENRLRIVNGHHRKNKLLEILEK